MLADLAKTKPQLILDITFPAFLAELPDSGDTVEKRDASMRQRKGYKTILAAFAQISSEREIFQVLLRRLFSKLDIVLSSMSSWFISYLAASSITYPHAILGTIFLVIQKKAQSSDVDLPSYMETLVPTLLHRVIVPAAITGHGTRILCSREVVHVVALIINAVVRVADVAAQNEFYKELFKLFVSCEPSKLVSSNQELVVANFRPFSPDAIEAQAETVQIFVSAIVAARKEVIPSKHSADTRLRFLLRILIVSYYKLRIL